LAVSTEKRLPNLPELPTIGESLPGLVVEAWNGLLGPAGLSPSVLGVLERESIKAVRDPAVIEKLQKLGIVPGGSTAAEFGAILQKERAVYRDAVIAAGISSGG
jgi:tripartite-type tricarboxylate transporter receptor subunit TctC